MTVAPPATLLGALGPDWVYVGWNGGRVVLETTAPVTLEKRLALSVLLDTANGQAAVDEEAAC